MRDWKCCECGTSFKRDVASAWQIANKFSTTAVASTVELSESKDSAQKAKGRREAPKRDEGARKSNVPVADQAEPARAANASAILSQKPPGASGQVLGQISSGARASRLPVTEVDALASCAVETPGTLRKQDTLANAAGAPPVSVTKAVRRRRR